MRRSRRSPRTLAPPGRRWCRRKLFRGFGVEPTQYRSAAEALLRRLTKQGGLPSVGTLVDLANLVSIRFALPVAVFERRGTGGGQLLAQDRQVVAREVPAITRRLAERGILLEVEGAYLLQTPAAAEWAADYQAHIQDLRTDVRWQADRRTELLREAFAEIERGVKPRQGKSLVAR